MTSFAAEIDRLAHQISNIEQDMRLEARFPGMRSRHEADSVLGDVFMDAFMNVALGGGFAVGGAGGAIMDAVTLYDTLGEVRNDQRQVNRFAMGQRNAMSPSFSGATKASTAKHKHLKDQMKMAQSKFEIEIPQQARPAGRPVLALGM